MSRLSEFTPLTDREIFGIHEEQNRDKGTGVARSMASRSPVKAVSLFPGQAFPGRLTFPIVATAFVN